MKKIIFILLSLIFITSLSAQAVRTMTANPINIASRLILYSDSAKVATTLEYYGYELQSTDTPPSGDRGASSVFSHPDGTVILLTFPKNDSKQTLPTIQVNSKIHKTEAEKILKELDYNKTANGYETNTTKYSTHITSCKFDPGNTITFQRLPK